jgi:hypothetical protein
MPAGKANQIWLCPLFQETNRMKSPLKSGLAWLLGMLLGMSLMACQKTEGPAEQAGKAIDQAVSQTGEKAETATEKLGEQIELAGERMQDAAKKEP